MTYYAGGSSYNNIPIIEDWFTFAYSEWFITSYWSMVFFGFKYACHFVDCYNNLLIESHADIYFS